MEMLNLNMLMASDLWTILISNFSRWIGNYGWAIIVFTICLKLVMSPLDILQRHSSQKQSKFMTAMQPEMTALQQKYGNDKEKLNQEQAKLYKKYNVNVGGMCFSMLITLGVSLLVFGTLWGSLSAFGNDKMYSSYEALDKAYISAEVEASSLYTIDSDEYDEYIYDAVVDVYNQQKKENSWFWVKNVWRGDTNTSQLVDFNSYASHKGLKGEAKDEAKARYLVIRDEIVEVENPGQNGYYVLLIVAGLVSFLTQFLSAKLLAPKGQKLNTMNKVMLGVIPLTMIIFAATSNAVFTLYIITNSVMTAIISTIITLIMRARNKDKGGDVLLPKKNVEVVEYSRNYKK